MKKQAKQTSKLTQALICLIRCPRRGLADHTRMNNNQLHIWAQVQSKLKTKTPRVYTRLVCCQGVARQETIKCWAVSQLNSSKKWRDTIYWCMSSSTWWLTHKIDSNTLSKTIKWLGRLRNLPSNSGSWAVLRVNQCAIFSNLIITLLLIKHHTI